LSEPRIIAVDWSGAKSGSARKIALAEARDGVLLSVEDGFTREGVVDRLIALAREGGVIAGLDFGFSMPGWYLRQRGFPRAHDCWRWLAEGDCADELLRMCEDPLWGRKGHRRPELEDHFRVTEQALRRHSIGPKSVFQIAGAGAVGTGSIRGMRELHRLGEEDFAVWPFDDPRMPLVMEIYPRTFYTRRVIKRSADDRGAYVRDESGVPEALKIAAAKTEDTFDARRSACRGTRRNCERFRRSTTKRCGSRGSSGGRAGARRTADATADATAAERHRRILTR